MPPEADTNTHHSNLRKVNILLQAIERQGKSIEYYAVDLSLPELERTFAEIPTSKKIPSPVHLGYIYWRIRDCELHTDTDSLY